MLAAMQGAQPDGRQAEKNSSRQRECIYCVTLEEAMVDFEEQNRNASSSWQPAAASICIWKLNPNPRWLK